jgi:hypothetical protein
MSTIPTKGTKLTARTRARQRVPPLCMVMIIALAPLVVLPARAQQGQPDQPSSDWQDKGKQDKGSPEDANPKNDRIFKVIPNYTTVEVPTTFTPITAKQKFKLGAEDAFDPYEFPLAGVVAGIAQARNDDASWGQGFTGYAKRYSAAFADTTIGSFMTTGIFPSVLKEDPRYFRKVSGGFLRRSGYAMKRIFVTRTDSDHGQFNYSEFGGNAVAAAISLTYHSPEERTFSNFGNNYVTQITIDVIANQLKEFWPDIRRKIFKKS